MATAKKRPVAKVRRAQPLDVSNVVRLLLAGNEETKAAFGQPDEARLTALVLDLITTGYVAVAEISGRVVGTLGFSAYQPAYTLDWVLDGEWFYLLPNYRETGLGQTMLRMSLKWVDRQAEKIGKPVPLRLSICRTDRSEFIGDFLALLGFTPSAVQYVREKNDERRQQENDTDGEPSAVVRGSGEVSAESRGRPERPAV